MARLEQKVSQPNFWDNPDEAQRTLQQLSQMKSFIEPWLDLDRKMEDLKVFVELASEEAEGTYEDEINAELAQIKSALETLELSTLLGGEHDRSSAILEINAGAGGTESCDWVAMLMRMYLRWAERKGCESEIIDLLEGDVEEIGFQVNRGFDPLEVVAGELKVFVTEVGARVTAQVFEGVHISALENIVGPGGTRPGPNP